MFKKKLIPLLIAAACGSVHAADTLTGLGALPGHTMSTASAVSADGGVVAGSSLDGGGLSNGFKWESGTMTDLGFLAGGTRSAAYSISGDGTTIVGGSEVAGGTWRAVRWQGGVMTNLGTLAGGTSSTAYGTSGDGSIIVGSSTVGGNDRAFKWQGGAMSDLGTLAGGAWSGAYGVSTDGNVIVGDSDDGAGQYRAVKWQGGSMTNLGLLAGHLWSSAVATSGDGSVIVGNSGNATESRGFRWQGGTMTNLGVLPGGAWSGAYGVSGDGNVVVGQSDSSSGVHAIRWTQAGGMQTVAAWLSAAGVTVPAGQTLMSANATNNNGTVVVGQDSNNVAWLARVGAAAAPGAAPATGSGLISLPSYTGTLTGPLGTPQLGMGMATLAFNGAHHRPLLDIGLPKGKGCAWVTGDAGSGDHNARYELLEAGGCFDALSGALRFGAGVSGSNGYQDLDFGGKSEIHGTNIMLEAGYAVSNSPLRFSFNYLYGESDVSIRRAYLNGATTDYSRGNTDGTTDGYRLRIDGQDAFSAGKVRFTPYGSYASVKVKLAAYTESGGGFPARFNEQSATSDEMRLGLTGRIASSATTVFRGTIEAAHRFDSTGPSVTGEVLGLFPFAFAGTEVNQNWGRIGLDVDHRFADKSLLTASLQFSSPGEEARASFSLGWRMSF